jgi:hypothetical protein
VALEELGQHLVEAPGRTGDVEHGVALVAAGPGMQCAVEGGDPGKRDAALRILDEQPPQHLQLVGDAGTHDRVVDVADDDVPAATGRDEHGALGRDRRVRLEHELDAMPLTCAGREAAGMQVQTEIAVSVGLDSGGIAAEPGGDGGSRYLPPGDTAAQVSPLGPQGFGILAGYAGRLPEDPADQEDLVVRAVAAVGLDHEPAAAFAAIALRAPDRPDENPQRLGGAPAHA